jgi:hypothetical protein
MYCPHISSIPHVCFYFKLLICIFSVIFIVSPIYFVFILNYWPVLSDYFRRFACFFRFSFNLVDYICLVFWSFRYFYVVTSGLSFRCEIQQELRNCAVTIISRCDERCVWEWTRIFLLRNSGNLIIFIILVTLLHFIEYGRELPFITPFLPTRRKADTVCCVVWWYFSYQISKQLNVIHEIS